MPPVQTEQVHWTFTWYRASNQSSEKARDVFHFHFFPSSEPKGNAQSTESSVLNLPLSLLRKCYTNPRGSTVTLPLAVLVAITGEKERKATLLKSSSTDKYLLFEGLLNHPWSNECVNGRMAENSPKCSDGFQESFLVNLLFGGGPVAIPEDLPLPNKSYYLESGVSTAKHQQRNWNLFWKKHLCKNPKLPEIVPWACLYTLPRCSRGSIYF